MLPLPSGKKQNRKKKLTIDEFFKLVFKEKIIKFDKNFAELRFYNVFVLFIHSLSKQWETGSYTSCSQTILENASINFTSFTARNYRELSETLRICLPDWCLSVGSIHCWLTIQIAFHFTVCNALVCFFLIWCAFDLDRSR